MPHNPYYDGPISDHFDGLRFLNPAGEPETDRSFGDMLKWQRERPSNPWPATVDVVPVVPDERVEDLRITMVGHATLLIQIAGLNILTDPVWSDRASPFTFAGPRRVTKPGVAIKDLPPIDVILLSHNHYDHLDMATLKRLHAAHKPIIVTPLGNDAIVRKGIKDARLTVGDWGDSVEIAPEAHAHIVPALHWSSRSLRDRRMALWCGFVLEVAGKRIYFAGDTGYGTGNIFRRIGETFSGMDLAILPIGAYDPRWFMAAQHCDPEDAIKIMLDVKANMAIGMHWGTFKLTDEARLDPEQRLAERLKAHDIDAHRFRALHSAEVIELG